MKNNTGLIITMGIISVLLFVRIMQLFIMIKYKKHLIPQHKKDKCCMTENIAADEPQTSCETTANNSYCTEDNIEKEDILR